jgi:hypothetical protein
MMAPTVAEIRRVNAPRRWDLSSLWGSNEPADWGMCTPTQSPSTGRSGGYGQTEVIGTVTFYGLAHASVSTFGRPLPSIQLRIVDGDGAEVEAGETGEIIFRGPTVMRGFFTRPQVNDARIVDGWLHTGDLGRSGERGGASARAAQSGQGAGRIRCFRLAGSHRREPPGDLGRPGETAG